MSDAPMLRLALADHTNVHARQPMQWDESGALVLSFRHGGRDEVRLAARAKAFDQAFLDPIRQQLHSCREGKELKRLRAKLEPAEKALAEVRRQQQRLQLDRETAIDTMTGEALMVKLGQLDAEVAALQQRLDAASRGLGSVKSEVAGLEAAVRGAFLGWVSAAALAKLARLRGRRERFTERLREVPLVQALTEFEQADAEAGWLENGEQAMAAAQHVLREFMGDAE